MRNVHFLFFFATIVDKKDVHGCAPGYLADYTVRHFPRNGICVSTAVTCYTRATGAPTRHAPGFRCRFTRMELSSGNPGPVRNPNVTEAVLQTLVFKHSCLHGTRAMSALGNF